MFRVCGPGRALPTGTLTIIDDDDDGNAWFDIIADDGRRSRVLVKGYRVGELFPPSVEVPSPTGTITGMTTSGERTWHFFKELPVSAQTIKQTVCTLRATPQLKTEE